MKKASEQVRVILEIENVDFGLLADPVIDPDGEIGYPITKAHGNIVILAGMIEDEPDEIMVFGRTDGEEEYRVAVYGPFTDIQKMWRKIVGIKKKEES